MNEPKKQPPPIPTVARRLPDGRLVELLHDPIARRSQLAVGGPAGVEVVAEVPTPAGKLVPYNGSKSFVEGGVLLLPERPSDYESEASLLSEIQSFIHRYVDVSPNFESIAAHYVLLTWVYDRFQELPYLRVRGDYGSGKTRFLLVVGALCYRPVFASGASTTAPIFHSLETFSGTLVVDEGDFRASDEKAEIVKILNNGNVRGMPVLRMEVGKDGKYYPRAFKVFGPKIVATRSFFEDEALESRFITEEMGRSKRSDIRINLDESYHDEARAIRNKLLSWRFENFHRVGPTENALPDDLEPRLRQVFGPLLSLVKSAETRAHLVDLAASYQEQTIAERGLQPEAVVLEAMQVVAPQSAGLPIGEIAGVLASEYAKDLGRVATPRWAGGFVRKRLRLATHRVRGTYFIPLSERDRIDALLERYGLDGKDNEDVEDVGRASG